MYYAAFDTLYDEDSGHISYDRDNILETTSEWNSREGYRRFLPLAIDQRNRRNPYRNNPHQLPIPLAATVTPVRQDWDKRVIRLLDEFFDPHHGVQWNYKAWSTKISDATIEFSTALTGVRTGSSDSERAMAHEEGGYSYRLSIGNDPGWAGTEGEARQLRVRRGRRYYKYYITDAYLSNENKDIMHAVFRLLFMGDPFLTPFLSGGRTILSAPQEKAMEGFRQSLKDKKNKGAIILPTGVGKTVVAAKITLEMKPKRLLFISHRNFILNQAIKTLKYEDKGEKLIKPGEIGKFYGAYNSGVVKKQQLAKKYVFANPQSLNRAKAEWGAKDAFDLIIVDEFHHSGAKTWKNIIDYFKPKFLLGLTATPHRSDAEPLDLVEQNVLYEAADWEDKKWAIKYSLTGINDIPTLSLSDAIKLGYLVYPKIRELEEPEYPLRGGGSLSDSQRYRAKEVRDRKILQRFKLDVQNKQAIVFCSRVKETVRMAEAFNEAGIISDHLVGAKDKHRKCCSDSTPYEPPGLPKKGQRRSKKLLDFEKKKIQVLFVVDVLNEGVDIQNIEVILWLRKLDSIVMLLQQLGRGLRLSRDKRELLVLDFMGNISRVKEYIKQGFKPLVEGEQLTKREKIKKDKVELQQEVEILECLGFVTQRGEDTSIEDTPPRTIPPRLTPLRFLRRPRVGDREQQSPTAPAVKKIPKLTTGQKAAIEQTSITSKELKDKILEAWEERQRPRLAGDPSDPPITIAKKLGVDLYNMTDYLYEKGLISKPEPFRHLTNEGLPSTIESNIPDSNQHHIINQLSESEKRNIIRIIYIGNHSWGSRVRASDTMISTAGMKGHNDKTVCRILGCNEEGEHRGMCAKHYLFTYQEIYAGNASEVDLVARFLLEPGIEPTEKEPKKKVTKKKKKVTKKKKKKKGIKKKKATKKKKKGIKKRKPLKRKRKL